MALTIFSCYLSCKACLQSSHAGQVSATGMGEDYHPLLHSTFSLNPHSHTQYAGQVSATGVGGYHPSPALYLPWTFTVTHNMLAKFLLLMWEKITTFPCILPSLNLHSHTQHAGQVSATGVGDHHFSLHSTFSLNLHSHTQHAGQVSATGVGDHHLSLHSTFPKPSQSHKACGSSFCYWCGARSMALWRTSSAQQRHTSELPELLSVQVTKNSNTTDLTRSPPFVKHHQCSGPWSSAHPAALCWCWSSSSALVNPCMTCAASACMCLQKQFNYKKNCAQSRSWGGQRVNTTAMSVVDGKHY